jgi:hypothetical protein
VEIEWEKIVEGDTETWRLKIPEGWLYRVDHCSVDDTGKWVIQCSTMSFVPGVVVLSKPLVGVDDAVAEVLEAYKLCTIADCHNSVVFDFEETGLCAKHRQGR